MKARRLIEGASYHPDTLKVMGEAFEEAWKEIAGTFVGPMDVEAARTKLAEAVLSVAQEGASDVEALKTGALEEMARRSSQS